ncbi:MAG TPA: Hsp20/alpha crystallin family protein [Chthoniobacteraceae bacterium]|jgi:HSP20 family protein|nr:hspA 1 [Chthoniobacter sp.]HEV7868161.1 Hsp20/alpha crystallin family protein [Chthoniobacteraceae bacterium]
MSLIRYQLPEASNWPSFDRLSTVRDEIDRLFDLSWPTRDSGLFSGWSPALDVHDDKENFVVHLELPGMKKEDINLSLHDGMLTVSGERKQEREQKNGGSFRSERYFGKFQRSVTLPALVDASKVSASYKDGVLIVTLPKSEEAKPKQIEVSVS